MFVFYKKKFWKMCYKLLKLKQIKIKHKYLPVGRVYFRIAPLNNQIAPLWGVGPTLGNTALNICYGNGRENLKWYRQVIACRNVGT